MAREQGDELPNDPTVYVHPDIEGEQTAYAPSDVVNLEARGWRPKGKNGNRKAPAGGSAAAAESN